MNRTIKRKQNFAQHSSRRPSRRGPSGAQLSLLLKMGSAYGGALLKTHKGRSRGRPIDTRNSLHLVLRSSRAVGAYFFKAATHASIIDRKLKLFANKYGIAICSYANNGNHLHLHLRVRNRHAYKAFIRAITAAIAMLVSRASRWRNSVFDGAFWDYRPFSRVVCGFRDFVTVRDYVSLNQLESVGHSRVQARFILASRRVGLHTDFPLQP